MTRRIWIKNAIISISPIVSVGCFPLFASDNQLTFKAPPWKLRAWRAEQGRDTSEWVDHSILDRSWAYLDFWASWCVPCRLSFPFMNELKAKYETIGLKIFAISVDKESRAIAVFVRQNPADFSILWDPEGASAKAFEVPAMPSSFLINPQGRIVMRHTGFRVSDRQNLFQNIGNAIASR